MSRRDESKLEAQREVTRVLDNLMHNRPRRFIPRFPRIGLYVHCMESTDPRDDGAPIRFEDHAGRAP